MELVKPYCNNFKKLSLLIFGTIKKNITLDVHGLLTYYNKCT